MKPLKCYVGVDQRFVLCEKFPDDEEHAGLHELLDHFLYDDCTQLDDNDVPQGFYNMYFHIAFSGSTYSDPQYDSTYLEILRLQPIKGE